MSGLRDWLERHTWRPLTKQRQTGQVQTMDDPGHHRGELAQVRPKLLKDDRDCQASDLGYELSCDLPKDHDLPHYDAEYGVAF
jgi:hypothetical protein